MNIFELWIFNARYLLLLINQETFSCSSTVIINSSATPLLVIKSKWLFHFRISRLVINTHTFLLFHLCFMSQLKSFFHVVFWQLIILPQFAHSIIDLTFEVSYWKVTVWAVNISYCMLHTLNSLFHSIKWSCLKLYLILYPAFYIFLCQCEKKLILRKQPLNKWTVTEIYTNTNRQDVEK